MVDVHGVVASVGTLNEVYQKTTGRMLLRRVVQLCDDSGAEGTQCEVTLWEDHARNVPSAAMDGDIGAVFQEMRVAHYKNTQSLGTTSSSCVKWGGENNAAIMQWWTAKGKTATRNKTMPNVSRTSQSSAYGAVQGRFRTGLNEINTQQLGHGTKSDWINVCCTGDAQI